MRIAIVLFERFTALDAVGPYEILSRLPGAEISFVAERPGRFHNEVGSLVLEASYGLDDVTQPDVVLVPGGPGQTEQMNPGPLHEWLRGVDERSTWTTSVCTGSLVLAAAGVLSGRTAASHWLALDQLTRYGVAPSSERVVFDGKYVTAAGVSSGIDMALHLSTRIAGSEHAQRAQLGTQYDPQPPFDAGDPRKAPGEVVRTLRSNSRFVLGS